MDNLDRTTRLLEAIRRAQSEFILDSGTRDSFRVLLDALLSLTESEYGFIGEVEPGPNEQQLRVWAYTDISWNDATRKLLQENAGTGLVFDNLDSLFGYAIRNDQVVIANDAKNDPRAGGIPDGHPALNSFLAIPFHYGNQLIGLIGLANCPRGYLESDVDFLSPLITTCGILAYSRQMAEERASSQQSQHANDRSQRLVQFSQKLSHELNNLLTVTLSTLESLQVSYVQLNDEQAPFKEEFHKVHLATKQAAEITKKILTYSGSTAINRSPTSVAVVAREALAICGSVFPPHVEQQLSISENMPDVLADAPAFQQALINMILNSVEAIGDKAGTVSISARMPKQGKITLEVRDDGQGMDRKTRERAFDPYFSTKAENRGFGLASVHGFVKSHDALMEVDSEEGKGTSIRITMSCATTPRRTPQIEGDFQFENKRILIVDDDTVVLSAVSKLLMRLGADVSTADSGEAALAVLNRADNMDLVLLDVSMPAVDGVETSRRIRAKAASLPIVFMSGHTRRAVPLELSTDDNSTFLSKPFSISALHKACANVFKSKGQDG